MWNWELAWILSNIANNNNKAPSLHSPCLKNKFVPRIATGEAMNPIKQDVKNGVLREYKWGDMLFNYGAFPQTWEDPKHVSEDTGYPGDNALHSAC